MRFILLLRKITFLLLFNIVCLNLFYGQTSEIDLHKKYWYYKTRFNNDFVSVGTNSGQSIPFNQRGFTWNTTYTTGSILKTGDATAQLGIYIGVLATEYRLLKDKGQDVSKVKHELFCALNSVNRLDYFAEPIISGNPHPKNPNTSTLSPSLNGFFVRDDIPEDFVKDHYKELNYYNSGINFGIPVSPSTDKGFTQIYPTGQLITNSDYQSFYSPINVPTDWDTPFGPNKPKGLLEGKEESQDQLYYLLMGTALASKLVDEGETDGSNGFCCGAGNSDLRQEAINIADRLISYVSASNWKILNPANGNAFVQVGHDAGVYSYALDNAGCFIKHNDDFPSYVIFPNIYLFNPCNDFRNFASLTPLLWNHLIYPLNGGPKVDMQGFYHAMMGVCNCSMENKNFLNMNIQAQIDAVQAALNTAVQAIVDKINDILDNLGIVVPQFIKDALSNMYGVINNLINEAQAIVDQLTSQLPSALKVNTTEERLIYNNYSNAVIYKGCSDNNLTTIGSQAYFGIFLWKVLHPNPAPLPNWLQQQTSPITSISYSTVRNNLKSILDAAPCEGNYNFYPIRPGPEWGNPNRIDRMDPTYRYNTTCPTAFLGEYHGLDYMLLHNLYYLAEGTSSFINYSERNITYSLPVGNNFTSANKNTLGGYEYITASNIINSNAAADYRAGKEIALLPNFSVVQGADFSAKINPYACGGNNQYNGEMLKTTTQNSEYAGEGKPKKSIKNKKPIESADGLNSEQTQMLSDFKEQLDSLFKMPNYSFQSLASKIEIYPNPNDGNFNIAFNLTNIDNVDLVIIDVMGKVVFSQKHIVGFYTLPINLSGLSQGVYLARFENSNSEISARKITID